LFSRALSRELGLRITDLRNPIIAREFSMRIFNEYGEGEVDGVGRKMDTERRDLADAWSGYHL
jgi:hypothetical protein